MEFLSVTHFIICSCYTLHCIIVRGSLRDPFIIVSTTKKIYYCEYYQENLLLWVLPRKFIIVSTTKKIYYCEYYQENLLLWVLPRKFIIVSTTKKIEQDISVKLTYGPIKYMAKP